MLWALSFVVVWAMAAGNKNFDVKGRVSQVEFAKDAVGLSTAAFGALCADGVLLATKRCVTRPTTSRWLKEEPRCVHRMDAELGAAVVGIPADCALAVAFLREAAGQHRSLFGEAMACQELADALAAYLHDLTLAGDTRPLAVEVLLASSSALFRVDAGGSMQSLTATSHALVNEGLAGPLCVRALREETWADMACGAAAAVCATAWGSHSHDTPDRHGGAPSAVEIARVESDVGFRR